MPPRPFTFERMLNIGVHVCIDAFLWTATMLPIRALLAVLSLPFQRLRLHPMQRFDVVTFAIMVVVYLASVHLIGGSKVFFCPFCCHI